MTMHGNAALASVRVGHRSIPVRNVGQCHVCCSRHRLAVEKGLAKGLAPTAIAKRLPKSAEISARNVREHLKRGHVPVDHEGVQQFLREQARGPIAQVAFDGTVAEAAKLHFAREVMRIVLERMEMGDLEVTVHDGLRAARELGRVEIATLRHDEAVVAAEKAEARAVAALRQVLRVTRVIVGPEVFEEIVTVAGRDDGTHVVLLDGRLNLHLIAKANGEMEW